MRKKQTSRQRERANRTAIRKRKAARKLASAFKQVSAGKKTLTRAATDLHISPEAGPRFYLPSGDTNVRQGRRYRFIPRRRNDLPLYSEHESIRVLVDDDNASALGEFMAGVRKFLRTNRIEHLGPFIGGGVTDINGRFPLL